VQPDASSTAPLRSETSPPIGLSRLPAGPSFLSKSTSPASHPHSNLNSPRTGEHYSPISASPRSTVFDTSSSILPRDPRGPTDPNLPYYHSSYAHAPLQQPVSTTPPSYPYAAHYQNPVDLPSRRTMRESARLPPLTHEDTTWSSESGQSGSGYNFPPSLFPSAVLPLDPVKTMRTLPHPVSTIGPSPSPLDRPPVPAGLPQLSAQPPDYRTQGSLAALVRAGELASRVAEDEEMDMAGSP
jgi:hypothetical protein